MKKGLLIIALSVHFFWCNGQENERVLVTDLEVIKVENTCKESRVCIEESNDEKGTCIIESDISNCVMDKTLKEIENIINEKKRTMTTGTRNIDWDKYLKRFFTNSKLMISKDAKKGISILLTNSKKLFFLKINLHPIGQNQYVAIASSKFNNKEIEHFFAVNKPSFKNTISLVKIFLNKSNISLKTN